MKNETMKDNYGTSTVFQVEFDQVHIKIVLLTKEKGPKELLKKVTTGFSDSVDEGNGTVLDIILTFD